MVDNKSVGEREKGHEWIPDPNASMDILVGKCSCGFPSKEGIFHFATYSTYQAHLASLEAQPEPQKHCPLDVEVEEGGKLPESHCHADRDGDCSWTQCPQKDNPSAGQSDASLEQRARELSELILSSFPGKPSPDAMTVAITNFAHRHAAESRAAMREEAHSKIFQMVWSLPAPRENYIAGFREAKDKALEILRSLPADASALDARDARVRLEEARWWMNRIEEHHEDDIWVAETERIAQLQRSAEKGKGQ